MLRLAGILSLVLIFSSCAPLRTGHADRGSSTTLRIAQLQEPASLDPLLLNGTVAMEYGALIYSYLLKFDERGQLVPDIATEVPSLANGGVSRDQLHITYHLRHGVRFSDGAELTADDVVFTNSAVNNPKNLIQSRLGYDQIAAVRARDRYTVDVRLKKVYAPILALFCAPGNVYPIMPKHALARYPDINTIDFNVHPIGSGPFRVLEWRRGDRVILVANDRYWNGKPRIARIELRFSPDYNSMVNRLSAGDVDAVFNVDPSVVPLLRQNTGIRLTFTPLDGEGALIFNMQDPITQDARVRRALSMAIDVPAMVAKASHNVYSAREAGRGLFEWAYNPAALRVPPYDPNAARKLLDEAGWEVAANGVRARNGKPLDIVFILEKGSQSYSIVGNFIQQAERAVGINVVQKEYAVEQFAAPVSMGGPVYSGKFDVAEYPFLPGLDPDVTDQFACRRIPPAGFNKPRYCSHSMDEALARGVGTFDRAKRQAAYDAVQQIAARDLPMLPIYQIVQVSAWPTWLKHQSGAPSTPFWNVAAWSR